MKLREKILLANLGLILSFWPILVGYNFRFPENVNNFQYEYVFNLGTTGLYWSLVFFLASVSYFFGQEITSEGLYNATITLIPIGMLWTAIAMTFILSKGILMGKRIFYTVIVAIQLPLPLYYIWRYFVF